MRGVDIICSLIVELGAAKNRQGAARRIEHPARRIGESDPAKDIQAGATPAHRARIAPAALQGQRGCAIDRIAAAIGSQQAATCNAAARPVQVVAQHQVARARQRARGYIQRHACRQGQWRRGGNVQRAASNINTGCRARHRKTVIDGARATIDRHRSIAQCPGSGFQSARRAQYECVRSSNRKRSTVVETTIAAHGMRGVDVVSSLIIEQTAGIDRNGTGAGCIENSPRRIGESGRTRQ